MKQFFEQYGAVALGVLALIVLIAMITPVGNIIKTSLQGTVETFSTQISAQTDTALERAAYAQGVASDDIILVRNGSGSYSLSCEIDNANIDRYVIRANDLAEGVPASDLYYDYMSKECSVSEMKGVIHYSTTKEGLEDLGMSIYHWEGGTWVLISGDGTTKQSDRLPEVTGTVNYNGQAYELKYTLAFNSNGGTSVSSQKVSRIPENMYTPAKTGFTFSGWYTESSLINRAVSGTKLTGDTTVYAGWDLQNYTIAYNLDGGTLSGQKTSYTINDSTYVLPTPAKEGFTFEGWYDNSNFTGTAVTSIPTGTYGNKTYYAKWKQASTQMIHYSINHTYDGETINLSGDMEGTNTLIDLINAHSELNADNINIGPTKVYISFGNTELSFNSYSYSIDSGSTWKGIYLVSYTTFAKINGDIKCANENDTEYCFTDAEFNAIQGAKQNGTYRWKFNIDECLTGDTEVIVTDEEDKKRRKKKIKDIKVGDYILSFDWNTKKLVSNRVIFTDADENKFADQYDKWYFEDGTVIETVHRHEFYNCEAKRFMYMDEWNIGDHAYKIDGTKIALVKHEVVNERVQHYKITGELGTNFFASDLLNGDRNNPDYIEL